MIPFSFQKTIKKNPTGRKSPFSAFFHPVRGLLLLAAMLSAILGSACSRNDRPPLPIAGIFAAEGNIQITSRLNKEFQNKADPGLAVCTDQILEIPRGGSAALETGTSEFLLLGPGTWPMDRLNRINPESKTGKRSAIAFDGGAFVRRDFRPLIMNVRYEILWTPLAQAVRSISEKIFEGDNEAMQAAAYFFSPSGDNPSGNQQNAVPGQMSPWEARAYRVHRLARPIPSSQADDVLASAEGNVVVEFKDHATAFTARLVLPLPLEKIERVVVFEGGRAVVRSGKSVQKLEQGDVLEVVGQ